MKTSYSEEEGYDYHVEEKGKGGLTFPDQLSDKLNRLQAVGLLYVGEALLLQSLSVLT